MELVSTSCILHLSHQSEEYCYERGTSKSSRGNGTPLQIEVLILLHLSLGDLCILVWVAVEPQLAVNMLLRTAFKDLSIRIILPSEEKVVLYHSPPVPVPTKQKTDHNVYNALVICLSIPIRPHHFTKSLEQHMDHVHEVSSLVKKLARPSNFGGAEFLRRPSNT